MYKITRLDFFDNYDIFDEMRLKIISLQGNVIAGILGSDSRFADCMELDAISMLIMKSLKGVMFFSDEENPDSFESDLLKVCELFFNGLLFSVTQEQAVC